MTLVQLVRLQNRCEYHSKRCRKMYGGTLPREELPYRIAWQNYARRQERIIVNGWKTNRYESEDLRP